MNFMAENIHAGYVSGIDILRGLTIEARGRALTTIISANGFGKSTLLICAVGQQRLLEISRALLTNPALMLVDEPTVGLDPKMTGVIYGFLRQLVEEKGRTILMVDQNVIAGTDVADFIYVLEQGANKFSCSKAEFDSKYRASIADWLI